MENSGFFDAKLQGNTYDRVYYAETFAKYFSKFIGNGVFVNTDSSSLLVTPSDKESMKISIHSGFAWINGYWYENDSDIIKTLDISDGVFGRIDLVILRYDVTNRTINSMVIKGTPASNPVEPEYNTSPDCYDLVLAKILIPAGATKVLSSYITDTRLIKPYCGAVTALVTQIDTSSYGSQLNGFIDSYMGRAEEDYGRLKSDAESWIRQIESVFSESDIVEMSKRMVNYTYTIDSNGTFSNWVNNVEGNDYTRILIKAGTYTIANKTLLLSKVGTKSITGEGGAKLIFDGCSKDSVYAIVGSGDSQLPSEYFIENVHVTFNATENASAEYSVFKGCSDLVNVKAELVRQGTGGQATIGFNNCHRLTNCSSKVLVQDTTNGQACGFYQCHCVSSSHAYIGPGKSRIGFTECSDVSSCSVDGSSESSTGKLYKYKKCTGVEGTELTGVLSAGATGLTIQSELITANSTFDIYTDVYGVSPKSVSVRVEGNNGFMTMAFKAQTKNVNVKVVVK